MVYVGIDYHKRYSQVEAMNKDGRILSKVKLTNDEQTLKRFFSSLPEPCEVVIEATRNWQLMYEMLEEMDGVEKIHIANPYKVKAIAEAKIKTDTIDAHTLAHLLRCNLIPSVYVPSKQTRDIKDMLRQRMFLVRMNTRIKNRIHALIEKYRIPTPDISDLFGKIGLSFLKRLQLPHPGNLLLKQDIELIEAINILIKDTEKEVMAILNEDERYNIARTLPGLGAILAGVVILEIDQIERFPSAKKLLSYAGLVPTTYASGGKCYHGHLIKQSNKWLRWAMVEAAWTAQRVSPYFQSYYKRHLHKGHNTAVCVLAKRLLEILWSLLTYRRPYEERPVNTFYSLPPSQKTTLMASCQV